MDSIFQNAPEVILPKKTKPNISQSLLKDYDDFFDLNKMSCGLYLFKKYYQKLPISQSDVQRLGTYFEYKCTNYVNANSEIPQPDFVYKGTPKQKLATDYERAEQSAQLYKRIIEKYDIKIISTGEYLYHEEMSGILDIRAEWNGIECLIDIKYTGLFDDKFSPFGWATDSLIDRPNLTIQPIHYKYLNGKIKNNPNIPFYFFIFHSKDSDKAKIIHVNVDEIALDRHEMMIDKFRAIRDKHFDKYDQYAADMAISYDRTADLVARPKLTRCLDCPYYSNCDKKVDVPHIEEIQIY
jgi:hypothetical protein